MITLPKAVRSLITQFERLPGIGPKSAQRLVFYLLHVPETEIQKFADALVALKRNTVLCSQCHNVGEHDPCEICSDASRDQSILCVVEQPMDVPAVEQSGQFKGRYHVLHGVISPLNNIGPEQIFLHDLSKRLQGVNEIILATNPTMEGEATALYIQQYLLSKYSDIVLTRIGHGLPVGSDIEYADSITIARALQGRTNMKD